VYAALTDDRKCAPGKSKDISEARFFREVPDAVQENEIHGFALADCSAK
jgi:hypothetical protein